MKTKINLALVHDLKVEASAIQAQIPVRNARGPFVGQDGILRPSGTPPFRSRNGANRRTYPRHKEAGCQPGCQPVCHPAPQRAGGSTFKSRTLLAVALTLFSAALTTATPAGEPPSRPLG